jgi:TonB-linked SusC/RagA family outer membrane protein
MKKFLFLVQFLLLSAGLFAQTKTITGTVTDSETGEPLTGVSIRVINSKLGANTDEKGFFRLNLPTGLTNIKLEISSVGYQSVEITPKNAPVQVKLVSVAKQLDAVVVVGYGTMKKKDLTGAIVQIKPAQIANSNPTTVQDILRGTPGLSVGYDPSANSNASLQVRGQNSVYTAAGHNTPLIVLDGIIFNGVLSEINPTDIAQIDVLKDASAAAIYGSRAASGVIIVTTKKGRTGKPVVNVVLNGGAVNETAYNQVYGPSGYIKYREDWYKAQTYGLNSTTNNYEAYQTGTTKLGYYDNPANLSQYGITIDQWRAYTTNVTGESDSSIYAKRLGLANTALDNYVAGKTFDWFKHTFGTGFNRDANISVSGAGDRMNYYLSAGYLYNNGAVEGNMFRAVRANMKLQGKVTNWLEIGANVNFQDRTDGDIEPDMGTNYWNTNPLWNSPYASYQNTDGTLTQYPMGQQNGNKGDNFDFNKQYLALEKGYTVLNNSLNAKITLPFNITYTFNANPRFQWYYNRYFMSAELPGSDPTTRGVDRGWSKNFDFIVDNTLNWDRTIAKKHHVNVTLGQEAENYRYWSDITNARYILPTDALGFHNTQNATMSYSSISTTDTHQSADALLARAFYSYNDRYMLTTTVRRDGYSAFGANNRYATFPSLAGAWSFSNERWFHWKPMSMGKLRVSWGKNGNRQLSDPYIALANLAAGTGATQGYIVGSTLVQYQYLSISRMANPNLQWEKTEAYNFGLDYAFFGNRLSGSIDYYRKRTHDMIMNQTLPGFSGFSSIATNLGEVSNRGIDIAISSLNIKNKNLEWHTTLNFSYNQNRIEHLYYTYQNVLDANGNVIGQQEMNDQTNNWFIGQPISAIWNYKVTGIWQKSEIADAAKSGQRPGDPKVANNYTADDLTSGTVTAVYNDKDKVFMGQTTPPVNWTLRNDFTLFKNWDISINIYSYSGHKSLDSRYLNQDNAGSMITYGMNTFVKPYWTLNDVTNDYGRLNAQGPSGLTSVAKLYNRSFIRLEYISFGYNFPAKMTRKLDISRAKIYGSIRNVAVWKKDKNWIYGDPETGTWGTRIFQLGLDVSL